MTEDEILVVMLDTAPTPFADNERGTCHDCGRGVVFRPYNPPHLKKVCLECLMDRIGPTGNPQ